MKKKQNLKSKYEQYCCNVVKPNILGQIDSVMVQSRQEIKAYLYGYCTLLRSRLGIIVFQSRRGVIRWLQALSVGWMQLGLCEGSIGVFAPLTCWFTKLPLTNDFDFIEWMIFTRLGCNLYYFIPKYKQW